MNYFENQGTSQISKQKLKGYQQSTMEPILEKKETTNESVEQKDGVTRQSHYEPIVHPNEEVDAETGTEPDPTLEFKRMIIMRNAAGQ